jgi:hypothetical protein
MRDEGGYEHQYPEPAFKFIVVREERLPRGKNKKAGWISACFFIG